MSTPISPSQFSQNEPFRYEPELPQYPQQYPYSSLANSAPSRGRSVASMVLGILSIVLCWLFGVPGLVMGIVAIVLAVRVGREQGRKDGMAVAGFVTGIIGTRVFSSFYVLVFIAAFASSGN